MYLIDFILIKNLFFRIRIQHWINHTIIAAYFVMEMTTRRSSGLTYQTNDITTVNLRIFLNGNPGEMTVSGGISILMIYIYNLTIVFPRPA